MKEYALRLRMETTHKLQEAPETYKIHKAPGKVTQVVTITREKRLSKLAKPPVCLIESSCNKAFINCYPCFLFCFVLFFTYIGIFGSSPMYCKET